MAMALSDELAEEILLRLPPDDPGSLVRAALSCKRALRLAADPGFRRRYRAFHGAAPMLGFVHNTKGARGSRRGMFGFLEEPPTVARFVPNLAASSSSCLPSCEWLVLHD
nr:unnamed protein product [Digitaria exilis]